MADVNVGDVLRLGCIWLLSSTWEIANVFHVRVLSGAPLGWADASDDMAEYAADIYDEILSRLSDNMDTHLLTLQNLTEDTTIGAFSWAAPLQGLEGTENTAPGVCCLAWGRTYKPRVQIRKYWGVFTEASMVDGVWAAAMRTDAAAAINVHLTSFTGTNGLEVLGCAYNRTLGTTTDAVSVASSGEPAYQRRRRRGRGS